jgi:hypothetical protein
MTTYVFYLKDREDPVEVEGRNLEDNGTRVTVTGDHNIVVAVFAWAELQGYTLEQ